MNYLPLIFQEINFVTEDYINLLNKIRKNKQEKDNQQKNEEKEENKSVEKKEEEEDIEISIKKFNGLRESISKRINELEDFYEDNIEDVRVSNFEKARLRLKKLLMYNYDIISKIENSSQPNNIFIKENNEFNKKITEEAKRKILQNNISNKELEKEKIKQIRKNEKKIPPRSAQTGKGTKSGMSGKKVKNEVKKFMDDDIIKRTNESGGKRGSLIKYRENKIDVGFDYDDMSKCREIIFKIKLNPEEYKTFLKEKKNYKGKVSPYLFK